MHPNLNVLVFELNQEIARLRAKKDLSQTLQRHLDNADREISRLKFLNKAQSEANKILAERNAELAEENARLRSGKE